MSKTGHESQQSRTAPAPGAISKPLLPVPAPSPARIQPIIARLVSSFRIGQPAAPQLRLANPGLDLMAEVETIRRDLLAHLPSDPHLRRLLIRHDALLREGEGVSAAKEADDIDAYVAEQAIRYARLRRKESGRKGFRVTSSAAFAAIEYSTDRKATATINFSITGAGHAARGTVRMTL